MGTRWPACLVAGVLASQAGLVGSPRTRSASGPLLPHGVAQSASPTAILDVVALDARGLPVTDLQAADFVVTVDGKPRHVVSARYVFRGPGAATAAAQQAAGAGRVPPAAETTRTIVIAVDEGSLVGGDERVVRALVSRLLDRLGPADALSVVSLPRERARTAPTTDRAVLVDALRTIVGRAEPVSAAAESLPPPASSADAAGETGRGTDRAARVAREAGERRASAEAALKEPAADADRGASRVLLDLRWLVEDLRDQPGLKSLVLVSAGLPDDGDLPAVQQVASAAAAARTTVHVLARRVGGWRRPTDGLARDTGAAGRAPDGLAGLPRGAGRREVNPAALATLTGGLPLEVGGNVGPAIERLARELSGGYAIHVNTVEADSDGRPHDLRASVRRSGVTVVRARRCWVPRDEPASTLPRIEAPAIPAETPRVAVRSDAAAPRPAATAGDPPPVVPDPALRVVLASAAEYLLAYERDLSAVVAEEWYQQVAIYQGSVMPIFREVRIDLQSDFLMVQPPGGGQWIPFRDVFAVNGVQVRDRDERLKKLFLEKPSTAMPEAQRITDESARYNVGEIVRNINVPTFPLAFLQASNQARFSFERRGELVVDGLRTCRIDYVERATPTFIVAGTTGKNVPVTGSFWVDPMNGRVVRTRLRTTKGAVAMDVTVVYQPSEAMGLWVPAWMKEKYVAADVTVEGEARYANLRRFRVLTEEQIKIPKRP